MLPPVVPFQQTPSWQLSSGEQPSPSEAIGSPEEETTY